LSTPRAKNLLLGAGKVLFDRWDDDGNSTGIRHLGNIPKFDLKIEVEKITKKQSMYAAKTTYLEVIKEVTASADVTIDEFDPANVAMAFLGEAGVITQASKVVTSETHTAYLDRIIQMDGYKISEVSVKPQTAIAASIGAATAVGTGTSTGTVTSSGTYTGTEDATYYVTVSTANTTSGSITGMKYTWKKGLTGTASAEVAATSTAAELETGVKVLFELSAGQDFVVGDMYSIAASAALTEYKAGTDYKTETSMLRAGLITIPSTSRITDGSTVVCGYTQAAGAFPKVGIATEGSVEGLLIFAGDPTKGPCYNAELWHVTISPNGSLPLIGDDLSSFDVTITVMDDRENHPDEPLGRFVKLA